MDKQKQQVVISLFFMVPQVFSFAITSSRLLINDNIRLDLFQNLANMNDVNFDWMSNPEMFKERSQDLALIICGYWIIVCEEAYFDFFNGNIIKEEKNADLHAAQTLLRILRNSFAHPNSLGLKTQILWKIKNVKYRKKLEIKEIGVILDATNLDGTKFELKCFGGWNKLLLLLKYLENSVINFMFENELKDSQNFMQAFATLEQSKWSQAEMIAYMRDRDFETREDRIKLAYFQEGEQKMAQETALNLLKMGLSVDQVVQGTGLSIEKVQQLYSKLD